MDFLHSSALAALLFGALSSVSLPIGAIIGLWTKPSRRIISAVMSFGAGSLIAAISFELVKPAMDRREAGFLPLAIGLLVGCLVFIALSRAADSKGAWARKRSTLLSMLKTTKRREANGILEKLGRIDILRSLPPDEVQAILPYVRSRHLPAEVPVFLQGSAGDSLYLIDTGRVRIDYCDDKPCSP